MVQRLACVLIALLLSLPLSLLGGCGGKHSDRPDPFTVELGVEGTPFAETPFFLRAGSIGEVLWEVYQEPYVGAAVLEHPNAARTAVQGVLPAGEYVFRVTINEDTRHFSLNLNVTLVPFGARGEVTQGGGLFDVANIDNILIDSVGGIWFGTDGNVGTNGKADALYYLDLNRAHLEGKYPTYGQAFRILSAPNDAEMTGPALNSDETTLFASIQHPGEHVSSSWPTSRGSFALQADASRPLSSVLANAAAQSIPRLVRNLVGRFHTAPSSTPGFPLANVISDEARVIPGLHSSVLASWLDPLHVDGESNPDHRFGANNDYITFFPDEDANHGWLWVNHEYVSNHPPRPGSAPKGQMMTLALFLKSAGVLDIDVGDGTQWTQAAVDTFVEWHKRQVGGSWIRVQREGDRWQIDRTAKNLRYDNTSRTLLRLVGPAKLSRPQNDDDGKPLGPDIAVGLNSDCSGGHSPWGTIFTAEENIQYSYGDLEDWWTSKQVFDPNGGAKAGGFITPTIPASTASAMGLHSDVARQHKDRDAYGYLCEIDPGVDPATPYSADTGVGHRKLGTMGRARWENAAFVVGRDGRLVHGRSIVIYSGDDRRGGRVHKWVSRDPYRDGMTKAQTRALLNKGKLYVAHFAELSNIDGYHHVDGRDLLDTNGRAVNRGAGIWIHLSMASTSKAPNASMTVGAVLRDKQHNGMGAFRSESDVLKMLYTAANKIGVRELNRPEDVEWAPLGYADHGPLVLIAFTKHGRPNALDESGRLNTDLKTGKQINTTKRDDRLGALFALKESGEGRAFEFWAVHRGSNASTPSR